MREHPAARVPRAHSRPRPTGMAPQAIPLIDNMIAIASGKGGVGKTWLSITLAHTLADQGRKVLLFDGDLGLANVDIQLGLSPQGDLMQALQGRASFRDVVTHDSATGIDLVAGRSGVTRMADADSSSVGTLCRGLGVISAAYDHVILDLGAGIDLSVRTMSAQAAHILVVTNVEPTSITDAYALIKLMHQAGRADAVEIVINGAASSAEGQRTWQKLATACENFLGFKPPLAAVISADPHVPEAIRRQMPLRNRHPNCQALHDVAGLAERLRKAA